MPGGDGRAGTTRDRAQARHPAAGARVREQSTQLVSRCCIDNDALLAANRSKSQGSHEEGLDDVDTIATTTETQGVDPNTDEDSSDKMTLEVLQAQMAVTEGRLVDANTERERVERLLQVSEEQAAALEVCLASIRDFVCVRAHARACVYCVQCVLLLQPLSSPSGFGFPDSSLYVKYVI